MVRSVRRPKIWARSQDSLLKKLVGVKKKVNWNKVSNIFMKECNIKRTGKQCRDRWNNYLKKGLRSEPFTEQEIDLLLKLQAEYGSKWAAIAKHFIGKTENQVKNFFYSTIRRNVRKYNKGKSEKQMIMVNSIEVLKNEELRKILLLGKKAKTKEFIDMHISDDAQRFLGEISWLTDKKNEITNQSFLEEEENEEPTQETQKIIPFSFINEENNSSSVFTDQSDENSFKFPEYFPMLDFEYN